MGDVAMTVPVIKNLLDQYPLLQVTVVSNAFFEPMFSGLQRCSFFPAHLKQEHKGLGGLYRLFKELTKNNRIDAVADLHGVLRATILKTFFSVSGTVTRSIDKGRASKKALTRKENKVLQPLPTSHQRYAAVFARLGLPVHLHQQPPVLPRQAVPNQLANLMDTNRTIIGIAPFAQHPEKMYPLGNMKAIVAELATNYRIILFGGGVKESTVLESWADEAGEIFNLAGKVTLAEELSVMSNLHLMISMDSANMHLASLFNIPVVSIWGATHPFAGFTGWGQNEESIVSIDLACRPCSVFGNQPCFRGDHACMNQLPKFNIVSKVHQLLAGKD
jgi:ADP-heptose:LPS heptosyltransferase